MDIGSFGSSYDFLERDLSPCGDGAVGDVLPDCAIKEDGLLCHQAYIAPHVAQVDRSDINVVHKLKNKTILTRFLTRFINSLVLVKSCIQIVNHIPAFSHTDTYIHLFS